MSDVMTFAGTWEGSYDGFDSGRKGRIRFELDAGQQFAWGDVKMLSAEDAELATIQILEVVVKGNSLNGKLAPYTDPGCSCEVTTEFEGTLDGDRIAGLFTTKKPDGNQTGSWSAARK